MSMNEKTVLKIHEACRARPIFTLEEAATLLEAGAKYLEREGAEGWTKGQYHADCFTPWTPENSVNDTAGVMDTSKKGKHCAVGAMEVAAVEMGMWPGITASSHEIFEQSLSRGGFDPDDVISYNDVPNRRRETVIKFMYTKASKLRAFLNK